MAFDVNGVLAPPNLISWEAVKDFIGRSVAEQIADRVMPGVISQLGGDGPVAALPAVRVTGSHDNTAEIAAAGGLLMMQQHVESTFHLALQGDGQADGYDLIRAARDQIAMAVADSAVFALEHRFEGRETSDTESLLRRAEGGRIEYRRSAADRGNTVTPPPGLPAGRGGEVPRPPLRPVRRGRRH